MGEYKNKKRVTLENLMEKSPYKPIGNIQRTTSRSRIREDEIEYSSVE